MENSIKLIPLIELPTKKDEDSALTPPGTIASNSLAWQKYGNKELKKNYSKAFKPISPLVFQYSIHEIKKDEDWIKIIELHIGDIDIRESCSLFGGYALQIDGNIELYPKCCGEFEEINDWKKVLDDGFKPFYLKECHPSPKFYTKGDKLHIECHEEPSGPFIPETKGEIIIDIIEVRLAVRHLIEEMKEFSIRLDKLSSHFGIENISDILIWGRE